MFAVTEREDLLVFPPRQIEVTKKYPDPRAGKSVGGEGFPVRRDWLRCATILPLTQPIFNVVAVWLCRGKSTQRGISTVNLQAFP